jgi:aliphatic sulfonates family ABC transporter substrate-binding protein
MNGLRSFAAIAALVTSLPATAADKVVMSVFPTTVAAPSSVGVAKGYFTEQGIGLESQWMTRGLETIQALGTGQVDLGLASITPVLAARAKGLPIVIIGLHSYGFPGYLVASKKNSHLTRLQDFKGKRIGVPVGTGIHTVLLMAIERTGLKQSDFQIQNTRVTDMPAAMQVDGFDAALGWIPYSTRVVAMGNGKVVMTPVQFEELAEITYPMVLITTENMIREKSDTLQRFMNAWAKSEKFVDRERTETVRILRQTLGDRIKALDEQTVTEILYGYKHDRIALSDADIADLRNTEAFLFAQKNIEAKPGIDKLINNSFAKKAEAMMK